MKSARRERGSAMIEFAGALILLSAMFTGIFQIGYTFFTYSTLMNAVRTGARYASLKAASGSASDPQLAKSVANMVVFGEPQPVANARPVVRGLAGENVELILAPSAATVSVRDFEIDALFTKIKLAGRPTVTFPIPNGGPK
jgi:Flp pilus assembly protein TadG